MLLQTAPVNVNRRPKSMQVAELVRERIDSGDYATQIPALDLLANEMGVTKRTVMRGIDVLEAEGLVSRIPRQGTFVTRLRRVRTHAIGTVLGGITAPLGSQLMNGMQAAADAAHQGLIMSCYGGQLDTQLMRIRTLVERNQVDGLVLWLGDSVRQEAVAYLREQDLPFVLVPDYDPVIHRDVHTVADDDCGATAYVMTHLIGQGHRDIAFVGEYGAREQIYHQHRYNEYRRSLEIAGLPVRDGVNVSSARARSEVPESDPALGDELRAFTAVFCETDRVAAIVHRTCVRQGIRIPDDLAVVGFDNSDVAYLLGLTSVEQNFEQIGQKAVRLLLDEIDGKLEHPAHLNVEAKLIIRGSSVNKTVRPGPPASARSGWENQEQTTKTKQENRS